MPDWLPEFMKFWTWNDWQQFLRKIVDTVVGVFLMYGWINDSMVATVTAVLFLTGSWVMWYWWNSTRPPKE